MADRADRRPITGLCARLAGAMALAVTIAGCASVSDPAGFSIVTQDKYDFMICRDIIPQRNSMAAKEKQLTELVEKSNIIVSAAAYQSELVSTRAQLAAANRAAQQKGCDTKPKS
jgi:hypothetical protein